MGMDCEKAGDLLSAYALNALDNHEAEVLEAHLEACPACRLALEQDQKVVEQLAMSVSLVDPPPDLKGRVLARIDALQARRHRRASGTPTVRRGWLAPVRPNWKALAIVGAGAVGIFLLAWSVFQTQQVNDLKHENVRLASDLKKQWDALTFVTSPNVETVKLASTQRAPLAKGSIFVDPYENRLLIMASNLPTPAEGEVYKLWMWRSDGSLVELATFRTTRFGYAIWSGQPPVSLGAHRYWWLTMEPANGDSKPSGDGVLVSDPLSNASR